jgi:hypothetical protein
MPLQRCYSRAKSCEKLSRESAEDAVQAMRRTCPWTPLIRRMENANSRGSHARSNASFASRARPSVHIHGGTIFTFSPARWHFCFLTTLSRFSILVNKELNGRPLREKCRTGGNRRIPEQDESTGRQGPQRTARQIPGLRQPGSHNGHGGIRCRDAQTTKTAAKRLLFPCNGIMDILLVRMAPTLTDDMPAQECSQLAHPAKKRYGGME